MWELSFIILFNQVNFHSHNLHIFDVPLSRHPMLAYISNKFLSQSAVARLLDTRINMAMTVWPELLHSSDLVEKISHKDSLGTIDLIWDNCNNSL